MAVVTEVQNAKQPIIAYFGLQTVGNTASIGSNINLTCIIENAELGTFLKFGRPVTEDERITYLFQGSARGLNSSLEIGDVQRNDSGVYSCIAYNAGIIATREFVLKTVPHPNEDSGRVSSAKCLKLLSPE
ncbi:uncharacterized protein [Montipora foliosa]|uniref:uncharacterized protein n=1 Tax=Montipora foliosa TaxID=591990 RepID=UPI0035F1024F